jgi:Zn-dependent protease with chaperone function
MVKALAVTPGLVISTVVTSMVGATLPALAGAILFVGGLAVGVLLGAGAGESAAARVLLASRPARAEELDLLAGALTLLCRAQLGPPLIRLRVRPGEHAVAAGGFGRRTVVVSAGLLDAVERGHLSQDQAAAVIAHAAALARGGWVRNDPVIGFWSLPWQIIAAVAQVVASVGRRLPLTSLVWRLRGIVIAIAVVQSVQLRQFWLAATIAGIGIVSYAMPALERRWRQVLLDSGDVAVREAGLAPPLAAFLRRCPRTPSRQARLRALEGSTQVLRPLGLVR